MFRSCSPIPLADIKAATNDFHESNIVGDGTEGIVYKGIFDYGQEKITAAVKRLKDPKYCDIRGEVRMLSKLRCPQVVSLLGHCQESGEKILIYEYMHNGNLYTNLHQIYTPFLWEQRLKICIDAAKGLHYLHNLASQTERIIHRDVKTLNILLNENWEAKIADFGLSKKDAINELQSQIVTRFRNGTPLYQPPELVDKSLVSRATDVYSFGVVLVEILSRTIPYDDHDDEEDGTTAKWAKLCIKKGKHGELIDYELEYEISPDSLKLFLDLVAICLDDETSTRPGMKDVVTMLKSALDEQLKFVLEKKIREDAARILQMAYREYRRASFQVRCALRDLAVAKSRLMHVRQLITNYSYGCRLDRDAEERQRFSEKIVALFVTVDRIKGPALMVRTAKKSILDKLEEMLNVVDPSATRMRRNKHIPHEEPNGETFKAASAKRSGVLMKRKELSPEDAAMLLQMTYRAHLIRRAQAMRALRELAISKSKLMELQQLHNNYWYCRRLARDAEEAQRFGEKIVVLILTVDCIEAPDLLVRIGKRSILGKLEEMLDVVPFSTVLRWRRTIYKPYKKANRVTYEAEKRAVELEKSSFTVDTENATASNQMKEKRKQKKWQEAFAKRSGALRKRKQLSPQDAAMLLQIAFRTYLIRCSQAVRSLRELAIGKSKLKELQKKHNRYGYCGRLARDAEEKQRFVERLVVLTLTVYSIEAPTVLVRTGKRSILGKLEEMLDVVDPSSTSMRWRNTNYMPCEEAIRETYEAAKRAGKLMNKKERRKDVSPMDAATIIQMTFRAHLVRNSRILGALRGLLFEKVKLNELRTLFSDATYRSSVASDAEERQRLCDTIIVRLIFVDAIEDADLMTRTAKISMICELEEMLDAICHLALEEKQSGGNPIRPTMTFKRNLQLLSSDLPYPTPRTQ